MSQRFRDCNGKSIYNVSGAGCHTPSNLYDQKNQVDSILEYMSQGLDKLRGVQGLMGDIGFQGIQGFVGGEGPTGVDGVQGLQGIQGPSGSGGGGGSGITVSALNRSYINTVTPATIPTVSPSVLVNDTLEDEAFFTMTIGFPFQLFGKTYTSLNIYSNSYFTFGSANASTYGLASYEEWISYYPKPGVFIGANDGNFQQIYATQAYGDSAPGVVGARECTIKFVGHVSYENTDLNASDLIWEVTLKENQPNKIFLKILSFNDQGGTEGTDFFSFATTGRSGVPDSYVSFDPTTSTELEINLEIQTSSVDYSGSKLSFVDAITSIVENTGADAVEVELGYVRSDVTDITGSNRVENIVSLTQAQYDSLTSTSSKTLYIIVD